MALSERLRPGVECAPWVIEEVKKLEAAAFALLEWDRARNYIVPYRVRDPIIAALNRTTGVKGPEHG